VSSQFLVDVLEKTFSRVVTAIRVYIDELPLRNLNIPGTRYRAAGEDAGVANLRMRKFIKQVEIAGGIHHVVVLIAVFAPGGERFPCMVAEESVLNHHSPFFALPGIQIDHAPRLVLSEFASVHGDRGIFVSLLLARFREGWSLNQRCPGLGGQGQCQTNDENKDRYPAAQLFHELPWSSLKEGGP